MTTAPFNRFSRDEVSLEYVRAKLDESLISNKSHSRLNNEDNAFDVCTLLHIAPHRGHRHPPPVVPVKILVGQMHGTAQNPIDLTETQFSRATGKPKDILKSIPMKFLKFYQDVRPPYIGTYTRLQNRSSIARLAKNPFSRVLPQTDYDYDSEGEWEEPGEGEDLDSEGEEELGDEEDEAEMEGFLDDAEAGDARAIKRRPIIGDMEPICTGICWEGPKPTSDRDTTSDLLTFKLDILMGKFPAWYARA